MASFIFSLIFILASANPAVASQKIETKQAGSFDISQYQGKVVYLDFWASWCVPCRKSFPWMNEMQAIYQSKDFVIVAVNLDKKKQLAQQFLNSNHANFEVIFDPKGKLAKKYKIKGMPSSILFNKQGVVVSAHIGFFEKKKYLYQRQLESLLN